MEQKAKLIKNIRHYYLAPEQSNMTSPQGMVKIIESFDRDALTIGFAAVSPPTSGPICSSPTLRGSPPS